MAQHPNSQPLNERAIRQQLADEVERRVVSFEINEETTSTNDCLLGVDARADARAAGFHVCLAESQTAGRGRRGRKVWHSPKNGNLYLSVSYCGGAAPARQSAWLGLMAAVEIVAAVVAQVGTQVGTQVGSALSATDLGVKWPNDLYCTGAKLGGVLAESKGDCRVVGLGLNLYRLEDEPGDEHEEGAETGVAWGALEDIHPEVPDRCHIASAMIAAIVRAFDRVEHEPPDALMQSWSRCDLLAGREVTVLTEAGTQTGVARGVDEHGGLRVEHGDEGENKMCVYYSNDVSVRW